ncbi:elongator complex protein [Anaeramoeba flamelloides]|uniref:Elongator complex protein 2 n=1 Tax=Anaeramoeba flamelloides TaxID=1746091 RepID=A0AAV7ZXT4_9EUKA|nr:elongator complex protein [Anaeramoeba flamelloides]
MSISFLFGSSGINETGKTLDWNKETNIISYGSLNSVVLADVNSSRVIAILNSHKGKVSITKWLNNFLLTADSFGVLLLWKEIDNEWQVVCKIEDTEKNSINSLDFVVIKNSFLIAISNTQGMVQIFKCDNLSAPKELKKIQEFSFGYYKLIECVSLSILNNETVILAMANVQSKLLIYTSNVNEGNEFKIYQELRGHKDWIKTLDTIVFNDGKELFLASGSQDNYIRIWRFFTNKEKEIEIVLESVLGEHDGWIQSVSWWKKTNTKSQKEKIYLLSVSMDKTMLIWKQDPKSKIWVSHVRVGDSGRYKQLGYLGGCFGPNGKSIIAHGFKGFLGLYSKKNKEWIPQMTVTGHFDIVNEIAWDSNGDYLISVSDDETSRLFSKWKDLKKKKQNSEYLETFYEIARPQIHGYSLKTIDYINNNTPNLYISGADESFLRVYEGTTTFVKTINAISKTNYKPSNNLLGAILPPLKLSSRTIYEKKIENEKEKENENEKKNKKKKINIEEDEEIEITFPVYDSPPIQDDLQNKTLWPEVQKMYGHENPVLSVRASHNGKLIISSAKSMHQRDNYFIVWETENWQLVQKIQEHKSEIIKTDFSFDDSFLISISRDRTFVLYDVVNSFKVINKIKEHSMPIIDCCWSPDHYFFVTGSRDKAIKGWILDKEKLTIKNVFNYEASDEISCLNFAPKMFNDSLYLAIGLKSGKIEVLQLNVDIEKQSCSMVTNNKVFFPEKHFFTQPVNSIKWCINNSSKEVLLACCGGFTIKIFNVFF